MKKKKYRILFIDNGYEDVEAFTEHEAKILAQAKRINKGKIYHVIGVLNT